MLARAGLVTLWLAAAGSLAMLGVLEYGVSRRPSRAEVRSSALESLPGDPPSARAVASRIGQTWGGWRVVDEISAQRVAVVTVEIARLDQARRVAEQLVEPYKGKYWEVLIYFRRPGQTGPLPDARIQWTPRDGYQEVFYDR
jgi:hypothetical protein